MTESLHHYFTKLRRMGHPLTKPAKLSSCWSKWHQTSYHQHCGHPAASPDLNLVDLQCRSKFARRSRMSVNRVSGLWRTCDWQWCDQTVGRRLRGFVDADGGQFEHSLWLTLWLTQGTSLSFLKCLTVLCRLHCYLFSIVFASAD